MMPEQQQNYYGDYLLRALLPLLVIIAIWGVIAPQHLPLLDRAPVPASDLAQRVINTLIDVFVAWAKPGLRLISGFVEDGVRGLQWWLHSIPWPIMVLVLTWLGWRLRGYKFAAFCGIAVLYMALSGHWLKSMNTLAMVGIAVPLALGFGFMLGVIGSKSRRAERLIEPCLDMMQTIPSFAYLVPLIVLFSFGPVPGVIASMIYAAPPITRNVILGLKMVPLELHDVAAISGASKWQSFFRIELPSARNQILVGLNQSVLASLSMVIIAAVIGGFDDIGREVLVATNKGSARFGESLSAGAIIVLMAVLIDLLSRAAVVEKPNYSKIQKNASLVILLLGAGFSFFLPIEDLVAATSEFFRTSEDNINAALSRFIGTYGVILDSIKNNALVYILLPFRIGLEQAVLPFTWGFEFTQAHRLAYLSGVFALSGLCYWRRRIGFAIFIMVLGLVMLRGLTVLPWWIIVAPICLAAWKVSGLRLALMCFAMMLAITALGHWGDAVYSVYLCAAAVAICVIIGCPVGVLAAKFDGVSRVLRPINDTLQSIPLYIFLIPTVALFQVNEFSALVAIVLYAIVPIIRYTEHGLRAVPAQLIEAATAQGCTPLQRLIQIELPVARAGILLGLNQTVLFALAMLIIAVLVGARGLAEQVNIGLRDANTGLGLTAGFSMAFIAIMADRILREWAKKLGDN